MVWNRVLYTTRLEISRSLRERLRDRKILFLINEAATGKCVITQTSSWKACKKYVEGNTLIIESFWYSYQGQGRHWPWIALCPPIARLIRSNSFLIIIIDFNFLPARSRSCHNHLREVKARGNLEAVSNAQIVVVTLFLIKQSRHESLSNKNMPEKVRYKTWDYSFWWTTTQLLRQDGPVYYERVRLDLDYSQFGMADMKKKVKTSQASWNLSNLCVLNDPNHLENSVNCLYTSSIFLSMRASVSRTKGNEMKVINALGKIVGTAPKNRLPSLKGCSWTSKSL